MQVSAAGPCWRGEENGRRHRRHLFPRGQQGLQGRQGKGRGAHERAGHGQGRFLADSGGDGEAEVADLDPPVLSEQDVLGLDVVDFRDRLAAGGTEPDWTGEVVSPLVAAGLSAIR